MQAGAFRALVPCYSRFFLDPTTRQGLAAAWTASAASTNRPGHNHSYTFLVMAATFVLQTFVGAASQHYAVGESWCA